MNSDWGLIVARVLLYGGTLAGFGLPAYRALAPASAGRRLDAQRWVFAAVAVAALVALAGSALHLVLLTAAMNGVAAGQVDRDMIGFVATEMPVGRAALVRGGALAILLVLALAGRGRVRIAGCVVAAAVASVSLAWNGHAAMNEGAVGWGHLLADQVHLLAAGVWLGSLVALLALTWGSGSEAAAARREAFAGFAGVGSVVVAALVATGVVNGVMILLVPGGGPPSTGYLLLLGAKMMLFVGALALAAHNRWRLVPALGQDGAAGRLRRSVVVELGLVAGTVVVVAALGLMSPTE